MHATHMEGQPAQYALFLAVSLLFKASKDADVDEPEASRRALAYVFGEQVLLSASQELARNHEAAG
jgi:hypothetical protein